VGRLAQDVRVPPALHHAPVGLWGGGGEREGRVRGCGVGGFKGASASAPEPSPVPPSRQGVPHPPLTPPSPHPLTDPRFPTPP
jgi:hypothetical protein